MIARAHIGRNLLAIVIVVIAAGSQLAPVVVGAAINDQSRGSDPLGLPAPPTSEPSRAEVALGHRLFFDRRLSEDRTVSCASCHQPGHAFGDPRPVSIGVHGRRGQRNAPSLLNAVYEPYFGWDGAGKTLTDQARRALLNPREMNMTGTLVRLRLRRNAAKFRTIAGRPPAIETVAAVIAAYVSTLRAGDSRVDSYLYAGGMNSLTPLERRGLVLFSTTAGCVQCHTFSHPSVHPFGGTSGLFTDLRFHITGAGQRVDPGRADVTGRSSDYSGFKTPSLRDVALTAPYMHDGSIATLEQVINFYNRGGRTRAHLDPAMRPLDLSAVEKRALVAFLRALTSRDIRGAEIR
jgi:cytochrome c peroxidase